MSVGRVTQWPSAPPRGTWRQALPAWGAWRRQRGAWRQTLPAWCRALPAWCRALPAWGAELCRAPPAWCRALPSAASVVPSFASVVPSFASVVRGAALAASRGGRHSAADTSWDPSSRRSAGCPSQPERQSTREPAVSGCDPRQRGRLAPLMRRLTTRRLTTRWAEGQVTTRRATTRPVTAARPAAARRRTRLISKTPGHLDGGSCSYRRRSLGRPLAAAQAPGPGLPGSS